MIAFTTTIGTSKRNHEILRNQNCQFQMVFVRQIVGLLVPFGNMNETAYSIVILTELYHAALRNILLAIQK